MTNNTDCLYCSRNDLQKSLMIEICNLQVSTVFLFREQTYRGRCVVAYKEHINELFELPETERNLFMADVCKVASVLQKNFHASKINYGAYSDKLAHLHFHIVPKYEDGFSFGGTFEMNSKKKYLSEEKYHDMIQEIKTELTKI
jgi:diadenosine tetraphosphate (Ap4A) HIT family hydrolase